MHEGAKVGAIVVTPGMAEDEALVCVHLADGRMAEHHVTQPLGSLDMPLSDEAIAEKLRALVRHGAPQVAADEVLATLSLLPTAKTTAAQCRRCVFLNSDRSLPEDVP